VGGELPIDALTVLFRDEQAGRYRQNVAGWFIGKKSPKLNQHIFHTVDGNDSRIAAPRNVRSKLDGKNQYTTWVPAQIAKPQSYSM